MAPADTAKLSTLNARDNKAPAKPAPISKPGGSFVLRAGKFMLALALLPACLGLTRGVYAHFVTVWSELNFALFGPGMMLKWFAIGGVTFGIVATLLWRAVVVYVFGHEFVHALATWMCLGSVSNLRASASGGQVTTSKSNTFIRLAPYCVPLYVILAALVYLGLNAWWRPMNAYSLYLAFALGFFYAFHIGFTLWSLRRDQPDLKPDGWLFSLVIIYLANLAIFVALMGFICGQERGVLAALRTSAEIGWKNCSEMYAAIVSYAQQLVRR